MKPITLAGLLKVAGPLIIATGSVGIKLFFDRLMLTHFDETSIRATMPAGILFFTIVSLFMGLVSYAQTLIAHYHGANEQSGIGRALKAGLITATCAGCLLMTGLWWSSPIFAYIGHEPAVQAAEVIYFNILCLGAPAALITLALSGFWSGRSRTFITMIIGVLSAAINIGLNYWFIYGGFGITELGIRGAAWGTVCADLVSVLIYTTALFFHPMRRRLQLRTAAWRDDLRRLIKFGLPAGLHRALDLAAFTVFVQLVGRYPSLSDGGNPQEAANITFSINGLVFIPTVGLGTAVGILCGQAMGAQSPTQARRINRLGIGVAACIQLPAACIFFFAPDIILQLFARADDPGQIPTLELAAYFLKFIAAFLLCDGIWMVTGSALSGVGDTKFLMWTNMLLAWVGFVLPMYVLWRLEASVFTLWWLMIGWAFTGAAILLWRWSTAAWEKHRVISTEVPIVPQE